MPGWAYDVIALGYPAAVGPAGPVAESGNLGRGWVKFDFAAAFGRPVRLALGDLPVESGEVLSNYLGKRGLDRLGETAWKEAVVHSVLGLRRAFAADSVLVGGGNAELFDALPEGVRKGGNDDAFRGGFRLWEEYVSPHDTGPDSTWRIVR